MTAVKVFSMSNAGDLGYLALADVAAAAAGIDYRIVGGHMVQLLIHAYPTPNAFERSTVDADAGINRPEAAGQELHHRLLERGYAPESGNHYTRRSTAGELILVDLLVPGTVPTRTEVIAGRGFDAIPGLDFALSAAALQIDTEVLLFGGGDLEFSVPVPDVEAALILKALAWKSRFSPKDLVDILSLLEIVHEHKASLSGWGYADPSKAGRGARRDAAAALGLVVQHASSGRLKLQGGLKAARLGALIRAHVPAPGG